MPESVYRFIRQTDYGDPTGGLLASRGSGLERSAGLETAFRSEYLTYRALWLGAQQFFDDRENDDKHGFWSLAAAALFVFMAYEGFLNDLGERIAPDVWANERKFFRHRFAGTLGKTRFLADKLEISFDWGRRPCGTLAELNEWRNRLVHSYTERISGSRLIAAENKPPTAYPTAFQTIERPPFVPRCFEDVGAVADQLLRAGAKRFRGQLRDHGLSAFVGLVGTTSASVGERGGGG